MNFEDRSEQYRLFLEDYLKAYLGKFSEMPQKQLYDAMGYSLLAGGKRLRPIFAFDFCRMCGRDWKEAAPFAAAMEMIHTYSLIHDDLPAMDNDDYRRGRLTNHKVFGEGMAILAGDALLTDAFYAASTAKLIRPEKLALAISVLAENAGSVGMVGGQVLDILSEERSCTKQEVIDIQSRKTGCLIKAACILGTIAGDGSDAQMTAASEFADALGMAFQIRDDMLDVIGTQEEMGKGVSTDANKNTFVRLLGMDDCERLVQQYTAEAIEKLSGFSSNEYMTALAQSLTRRRT